MFDWPPPFLLFSGARGGRPGDRWSGHRPPSRSASGRRETAFDRPPGRRERPGPRRRDKKKGKRRLGLSPPRLSKNGVFNPMRKQYLFASWESCNVFGIFHSQQVVAAFPVYHGRKTGIPPAYLAIADTISPIFLNDIARLRL